MDEEIEPYKASVASFPHRFHRLSFPSQSSATLTFDMLVAIALGLFSIGACSVLFGFVMHACVRAVLRRKKTSGPTPPISILKPLKGVDAELYENLASLARQDYPAFEMVLGTEDAMDPALAVARRVQRAFPGVRVRIVAGQTASGYNPKVANLVQLARFASHDHVLVSDADVRVDPSYLRSLAAEMEDARVGLVSSVIANTGERTLGASFDALQMNGFVAQAVCGAEVLAGHPCVVGKSMLLRKSDLEKIGGFSVVKDVLAEDYVLGQLYHRAGFRVALSGHPVRSMAPNRPFSSFFDRHLRWAQMRRHVSFLHHIGEPLLHPTAWFLVASTLALYGGDGSRFSAAIALLSVAFVCAKAVSDALLVTALRGESFALEDLALIPLKDLVVTFAWALSLVKTTVVWRGNVMQVGPGSVLSPAVSRGGRRAARSEAH